MIGKIKLMFVPYEMAVELKELGFDEPCLASFFELKSPDEGIFTLSNEGSCPAAIWGQVTEWLRDKHNIHIVIEVALNNMFSVTITPVDFLKVGTVTKLNKVFTPYESALESGIKAALTYITRKN